jgi:hypothetical protein
MKSPILKASNLFLIFWTIIILPCSFLMSQPINDNFINALDVSYLINNCSNDAAFTTIGATPDLNAASCWTNNGPIQNVWFKFTAPASGQINITIDIAGSKGTQRRTQLALWENDGQTEIACKIYSLIADDVTIGKMGLTPGTNYYFSVDTYQLANDGTFTLCMQDHVDYDFYEGALDVSNLINNCSADAIYNTKGGTPDRNAGSCWNNGGPVQNRWFKFQAWNEYMAITVAITGTKGTQRRTELALWKSDGTTEIKCARYQNLDDDVTLSDESLVAGNWYYFSVDTYSSNNDGSFTICLNSFIPLAAEEYNFEVKHIEKSVELKWNKPEASQNVIFNIEKSKDGFTFTPLVHGNSSHLSESGNSFSIIDNAPYHGITYYRLRIIDTNGKEMFSEPKGIYTEIDVEMIIYPNPIKNSTNYFEIQINSFVEEEFQIIILNTQGEEIWKENRINSIINNPIILDNQFQSGVYFLQLRMNQKINQERFEVIN